MAKSMPQSVVPLNPRRFGLSRSMPQSISNPRRWRSFRHWTHGSKNQAIPPKFFLFKFHASLTIFILDQILKVCLSNIAEYLPAFLWKKTKKLISLNFQNVEIFSHLELADFWVSNWRTNGPQSGRFRNGRRVSLWMTAFELEMGELLSHEIVDFWPSKWRRFRPRNVLTSNWLTFDCFLGYT